MIAFLNKIKLQHILNIALIGAIIFGSWAYSEMRYQKSESVRKGDNFDNLRDFDSLQIAFLSFKSNEEIEDYINSEALLKKLLANKDVKIKRLNSIIYQKQKYIDNVSRTTDISELVPYIRNNIESKSNWTDSTECLVLKGDVGFKDGNLNVNVNAREFKNEIAITGSWERNKWDFFGLWKWRFLGRKKAVAKATSKCGETKTIIIERKK